MLRAQWEILAQQNIPWAESTGKEAEYCTPCSAQCFPLIGEKQTASISILGQGIKGVIIHTNSLSPICEYSELEGTPPGLSNSPLKWQRLNPQPWHYQKQALTSPTSELEFLGRCWGFFYIFFLLRVLFPSAAFSTFKYYAQQSEEKVHPIAHQIFLWANLVALLKKTWLEYAGSIITLYSFWSQHFKDKQNSFSDLYIYVNACK